MDFLSLLIIFILSCFVGFYVIWSVTPALHSPLMAVTNAISSVIVVGAIIAAGYHMGGFSSIMGFIAAVLAFINIFGGFVISYRMIKMFKKKTKPAKH
jgi:NAD(P) transhydrogenase subunit alpha